MKLSEAIRLGSFLRPQGQNDYFTEAGGSCAVGAALEATGVPFMHSTCGVYLKGEALGRWDWLRQLIHCPAGCTHYHSMVADTIAHVNDSHAWSRERIADWIATIEPAEQSQTSARTSVQDAGDPVVANAALPVLSRL